MSYTFGPEIVKFTLDVYQPGNLTVPNWGSTVVYIDPETMTVLKDDESSDPFMEFISGSVGTTPDPFVTGELKILKPVWEIQLHYFARGGVDYEISEGWFEKMEEEWGLEAARWFAAGHAEPYDEQLALVNSWWEGDGEDSQLFLELEGRINPHAVEIAS